MHAQQLVYGIVIVTLAHLVTSDESIPRTKPGCKNQCGQVNVWYPFGIGDGCSLNKWFNITCDDTSNPPNAFLWDDKVPVYNISITQLRVPNKWAVMCYPQQDGEISTIVENLLDEESPFSFSDANVFTLVGCDDAAALTGAKTKSNHFNFSTCTSYCGKAEDVTATTCSGDNGCCQAPIQPLKEYQFLLTSPNNHTNVSSFNPCSYAFLGEKDGFKFRGVSDLNGSMSSINRTLQTVPLVLDWVIGNQTCEEARNSRDFACNSSMTRCIDSSSGGYSCSCLQGYDGYPYLNPDCTDINECGDPNKNECVKRTSCVNTRGSYYCSCPFGYYGDGKKSGSGCTPWIKFLGMGFSVVFVIIGIIWLYSILKRRKATIVKENYFRANGGMLLRQQSAFDGGSTNSTREFSVEELKKATNNYADDMVIGQGGYGIVYKGNLLDHRLVAIKKSRVMDKSQIEQFINEVVILTNINHRNVVKLLGCCLECEVPMLVYEFVSNGSLHEHIHNNKDVPSWLSLENRLRVAAESAGALAYLHSAASPPIIHRDVKSANILLDEHHVTKISDFGASRLVPLDQTQVSTLVQGTLGYLDPEYFHTGQLTDKSDVYSFGVVLAELLTGRKPLCTDGPQQERNLATYFIMYVRGNMLFRILDPQVKKDGTIEQLKAVAQLVIRCLNLNGDKRPTMKEVAMELEGLKKFTKPSNHPWVNDQHDHKETASLINDEPEASNLYSIQLSSYESLGESSKQFSYDTTHLLPSLSFPR